MNKDKLVYIGGNMLTKDSQMLRAWEKDRITSLGYAVYNPQDNKEINDKSNQTEESNNGLAEKIVRQDTDAIIKSDIVVIEPQPYACGTMVELGQLKGMKDMAQMVVNTIEEQKEKQLLNDDELIATVGLLCQEMLRKKVFVHYEDVRRTDIPEVGDRRSLGINQYVGGVAKELNNHKDGAMFYEWEEIEHELKNISKA